MNIVTLSRSRRLAVIGMGPRGLGALEALAEAAAWHWSVDVFDPCPVPGAGPNFDPDESPQCLLNIPLRDIALDPPAFGRCGGFADHVPQDLSPDSFPARALMGRYLEARRDDLMAAGNLSIAQVPAEVVSLDRQGAAWVIRTAAGRHGPYDEVLLTVGQPAVVPDDQLAAWQDHARRSRGILTDAYPARRLIADAAGWTGRTVAIRGMALSSFDILRALTTAQGGRFTGAGYVPSGREPARIVPFSLDGQPPFPKPETRALDARFDPTAAETDVFQTAVAAAVRAAPDLAVPLIDDALVPVIARILRDCGTPVQVDAIRDWLAVEWDAPGDQETGSAMTILREGIAMAAGTRPPSIGYAVGQVWRKWQDALRIGFNAVDTVPDSARKLIGFDEALKRYSYGPPVQSCREMLALAAAGLVDLDLTADPDITLTDAGWELAREGRTAQASVMIDAVMPAPDLAAVRLPLIEGLIADGRITAFADGFGARTRADGVVIGRDGGPQKGLALLGRLAFGSVIAVDSLHDCLGAASRRWAEGVQARAEAAEDAARAPAPADTVPVDQAISAIGGTAPAGSGQT